MKIHVTKNRAKKPKFKRITITGSFGDNIELKAEIMSEHKKGYNHESGSWGISKLHEDDTEAEFLVFREYRKRNCSCINKNRIVSIEDY